MSRVVNFACRIHPAANNDSGKHQWVTGFHNKLPLCVKCCRMLGQYSQTIWRSQYVMTPPLGREHYSVHSWKAGPDCGKISYYQIHLMWALHNSCPFQKSTERQFFAIALIKFDFCCRIWWTAYLLRDLIAIYGFNKSTDNTSNGKKELTAVFESFCN